MPMTLWTDIAGEYCEDCGELATHYYGTIALCCLCHVGPGSGVGAVYAEGEAGEVTPYPRRR